MRRRKVVWIADGAPLGKTEWLALINALPNDVKLVRIGEDPRRACWGICVESETFEWIPEGSELPELSIVFRRHSDGQITATTRKCLCDYAYTGIHRRDCSGEL